MTPKETISRIHDKYKQNNRCVIAWLKQKLCATYLTWYIIDCILLGVCAIKKVFFTFNVVLAQKFRRRKMSNLHPIFNQFLFPVNFMIKFQYDDLFIPLYYNNRSYKKH